MDCVSITLSELYLVSFKILFTLDMILSGVYSSTLVWMLSLWFSKVPFSFFNFFLITVT